MSYFFTTWDFWRELQTELYFQTYKIAIKWYRDTAKKFGKQARKVIRTSVYLGPNDYDNI